MSEFDHLIDALLAAVDCEAPSDRKAACCLLLEQLSDLKDRELSTESCLKCQNKTQVYNPPVSSFEDQLASYLQKADVQDSEKDGTDELFRKC